MLLLGDICSGQLCQHIHHKFFIGHVITQVLLMQSFKILVLPGSKTGPCLIDDIGKSSITYTFLDIMSLPLVSKILADLNAFKTLINPIVGIPKTFIVHQWTRIGEGYKLYPHGI